jgi:hypothetical protein
VPIFRFFGATDCFVEICPTTGRFGTPIPNSGCWSSQVYHRLEMLAQNLTLGVGSNQAIEQPPLVGANFVPQIRLPNLR